jgi:hypothetical protein
MLQMGTKTLHIHSQVHLINHTLLPFYNKYFRKIIYFKSFKPFSRKLTFIFRSQKCRYFPEATTYVVLFKLVMSVNYWNFKKIVIMCFGTNVKGPLFWN